MDFRGRAIQPAAGAQARIDVSGGRVVEQHVIENPAARALRLSFEVVPDAGARDVELRAFLRRGDDVLTETWSYLWQPSP